jgi:tetratricopeptide (TPR) repeat protein
VGRSAVLVLPALLCLALVAQAQTDQLEAQRRLRHAESLERAGQYDQALAELEILLNDWPSLPNAVLAYERVCRRQGRLEYAVPVVRRAVDQDPWSPLLHEVELRVLVDLGAAEDVRAAGERWLRAAPGSEVAYRGYAEALARLGEARPSSSSGSNERKGPRYSTQPSPISTSPSGAGPAWPRLGSPCCEARPARAGT